MIVAAHCNVKAGAGAKWWRSPSIIACLTIKQEPAGVCIYRKKVLEFAGSHTRRLGSGAVPTLPSEQEKHPPKNKVSVGNYTYTRSTELEQTRAEWQPSLSLPINACVVLASDFYTHTHTKQRVITLGKKKQEERKEGPVRVTRSYQQKCRAESWIRVMCLRARRCTTTDCAMAAGAEWKTIFFSRFVLSCRPLVFFYLAATSCRQTVFTSSCSDGIKLSTGRCHTTALNR